LRFDLFAFWFFLVFVFCVIFVGVWLNTEFFEFLEILWDLLFWVCFAFTGFVLLCCKSCESLKLFLLLFLLDFVFTILLLFLNGFHTWSIFAIDLDCFNVFIFFAFWCKLMLLDCWNLQYIVCFLNFCVFVYIWI
jgi:hypothetical protein